jgi:hypothetical protein
LGGNQHGGLYRYQAGHVTRIMAGDAMSVVALSPNRDRRPARIWGPVSHSEIPIRRLPCQNQLDRAVDVGKASEPSHA